MNEMDLLCSILVQQRNHFEKFFLGFLEADLQGDCIEHGRRGKRLAKGFGPAYLSRTGASKDSVPYTNSSPRIPGRGICVYVCAYEVSLISHI
jgi:hypothetical protein